MNQKKAKQIRRETQIAVGIQVDLGNIKSENRYRFFRRVYGHAKTGYLNLPRTKRNGFSVI